MTHHISYTGQAPEEIIGQAIDRSVSHDEIVHVIVPASQRDAYEALSERLCVECEGCGDDEYWGRDLDGGEWRVHLDRMGAE